MSQPGAEGREIPLNALVWGGGERGSLLRSSISFLSSSLFLLNVIPPTQELCEHHSPSADTKKRRNRVGEQLPLDYTAGRSLWAISFLVAAFSRQ